ncbi:hypothetical protein [Streptomyces sp. WAC06614]|nr:hypothetical protein [Streptomyces sp. WAC06614]
MNETQQLPKWSKPSKPSKLPQLPEQAPRRTDPGATRPTGIRTAG